MERNVYRFMLAGYCVECSFLYSETRQYFQTYPNCDTSPEFKIQITKETILDAATQYEMGTNPEYIEYCELSNRASDLLLSYACCAFHCAVILWEGKAYAFTGSSGVGKTTHMILWMLEYGQKVQPLNGDKPFLKIEKDGSLWVCSSPWNGKEGIGSVQTAPLAGIVLLKQGNVNQIRPLTIREALFPIYQQLLFSRATADQVYNAFALEEVLLTQIPVWECINCGDHEAARLCHDTILREK